eukprot:Gb_26628 [translate_table: standard]
MPRTEDGENSILLKDWKTVASPFHGLLYRNFNYIFFVAQFSIITIALLEKNISHSGGSGMLQEVKGEGSLYRFKIGSVFSICSIATGCVNGLNMDTCYFCITGVLEANFVEPAHDKQGFERTTVLARLENRLIQMQKQYWSNNCQKVGYANRRGKKTGKDSVSVPREIGASEISNACLTAAPILQSRAEHIPLVTAEPIPLVRNSVLVTTKSSLVEVEHRLCGKQQSRLNTEQAETENNLSQVLTNVINFPHEVFRQSPSRESSPQMGVTTTARQGESAHTGGTMHLSRVYGATARYSPCRDVYSSKLFAAK